MFEDEPDTKPGLLDCDNVVAVPHIASASFWTRAGMVSAVTFAYTDVPFAYRSGHPCCCAATSPDDGESSPEWP